MAFNSTPKAINEQNINGLLSCYDQWERVELAYIVKVVNGFAFKSAEFNANGEGNRLIRIRDILKGDTQTYFSGEVPEGYWVTEGDIIIGMDGDFNIAWWTGRPALLNQRVCKLNELTELFDKRLLFRLLPGYLKAINANTSSTTVKHLSSKTLEGLLLPLPPLAEQKVISAKLDILLAQVEMTKSRIGCISGILKTLRQSVLTAAMSGKLTGKWRVANSKIFGEVKPLSSAGKVIAGQSPSKSEVNFDGKGELYVTGPEQWNGRKLLHHKWTEYPKRMAPEGSIFITVKGAGVGTTFPGCHAAIGRDIYAFVPNENMNYTYILFAIQASAKEVVLKAKGLIPGLTKSDIVDQEIYLPSMDEQTEIARLVEEFFVFADLIEQQVSVALARINSLTQSILAKAFSGDLTADWRAANPDLISGDNSAETLLARIKVEHEKIEKQSKLQRTTVNKKVGSHMSKQIIKVAEALKQAGEPLSGQQLLAAAGYPLDSSTDQLEQFFLDIRDALAIEKSIVKLQRDDDSQDWFTLAKDIQP